MNTLFRVEVSRRLVNEQDVGGDTEHQTDGDSLQFSARQAEASVSFFSTGFARESWDIRLDILVDNGLDLHGLDNVRVELGVCDVSKGAT